MARETKVLRILETVCYPFAGLALFLFVCLLCSEIGYSFANASVFWPYFLYLANVIYLLFILHFLAHPLSEKKRKLTYFVNGVVLTLASFIVVMMMTFFLENGTYPQIVIGGITSLYPLDGYLGSFLTLIAGFVIYYLGQRLEKHPREIVYASLRGGMIHKVVASLFRPLYVLIALFFMGAILMIPATFDTSFAHFGGMLGFYLFLALPSVMLGFYEWDYAAIADPAAKQRRLCRLAVAFCLAGLVLSAWYGIASAVDPEFLIQDATALLPVDYMKSLLVGPLLLILTSLAAPLIAFFHFLKRGLPAKGKSD
jgi:hypothetical protein